MKESKLSARMMPHSIEAEQALLGCLLIDEQAPLEIMSKVKKDDFYLESHKTVFDVMNDVYSSNTPIDFITITDALEKRNLLDGVGGIDYITTLTNVVPSAANFKHYMDIVKRDGVLRKLIMSGQSIIENAYDSDNKEDSINYAEKQIFDISEKEETSTLSHIEPALNQVIEKLDLIAKDKNSMKGVLTGFTEIDDATNGFQKGDLVLLAARPSVGKTSLAMNIVTNAAITYGKKCAVFSLEMPAEQLAQRAIFSVASVSISKGKNGELTSDEWKSVWAAKKKLAEASIYVDDSSLIKPTEILSKCRRLKREHGLDLIMIDYLQLMTSERRGSSDNRQNEVSEISRFLKIAAKELGVPVIVLSQLSRASETRKDHRPILSDLRESGAIEQDADVVMFIYNPEKYNDVVSQDEPGVCEIIFAKNRNGETGTKKLKWIGSLTKFINIGDSAKIKRAPVPNNQGAKEAVMEEITDESVYDFDNI